MLAVIAATWAVIVPMWAIIAVWVIKGAFGPVYGKITVRVSEGEPSAMSSFNASM